MSHKLHQSCANQEHILMVLPADHLWRSLGVLIYEPSSATGKASPLLPAEQPVRKTGAGEHFFSHVKAPLCVPSNPPRHQAKAIMPLSPPKSHGRNPCLLWEASVRRKGGKQSWDSSYQAPTARQTVPVKGVLLQPGKTVGPLLQPPKGSLKCRWAKYISCCRQLSTTSDAATAYSMPRLLAP